MAMQMVKISFPDEESLTQGFYELMKRMRVVCLPADEFIVPERGLTVLNGHGIPYRIIKRSGLDHVLETVRDTAAIAA